jgi:hypothetical protein
MCWLKINHAAIEFENGRWFHLTIARRRYRSAPPMQPAQPVAEGGELAPPLADGAP